MSIASRRVAKRDAQERADIKFLNERGVHIVMTSTKQRVISRETVHALAEAVRAFDKLKASREEHG